MKALYVHDKLKQYLTPSSPKNSINLLASHCCDVEAAKH